LSYAPGSQYIVVGGKAYTASQVRTTSRSWDKGVLTDLCLTLYIYVYTHKLLSIYFHKNIVLKCWSIKDLSSFLLSPVKLCIGGLQETAVSCAKCCTVNSISQLFILVFRKVHCAGIRIFNTIRLNLTNLWNEKTQFRGIKEMHKYTLFF